MSGSAQTQTFQIEHLLQSYGEALAARRAEEQPVRATRFDSRSMLAGFLAVFVLAPGCATATVFLIQAESRLPPISHPQPASKANRMPLSQWKARAPTSPAGAQVAAPAEAGIAALEPFEIRGRLEPQTLAATPAEVTAPVVAAVVSRPKRRHETPRARPVNLVAEAAVPEAAPPSFLEKLFALRTL